MITTNSIREHGNRFAIVNSEGGRISRYYATADEARSEGTRRGLLDANSTRPDAARSATKPNSARRQAIRESLTDECGTCGLLADWSSECPDKAPQQATFGHIVALSIGGTWKCGNIITQCWSCNLAAKVNNQMDLSNMVIWEHVPARYIPTNKVNSDRRDLPMIVDIEGEVERKAARAARGLTW